MSETSARARPEDPSLRRRAHVVLGLLTLAAGCAHGPPAGLSRQPDELLAQVRANQDRVQRVRGSARVHVRSPGLSGTVLEVVAAEKPDRVRLETLDFFGNQAAVLVATAGRFAFFDAKAHVLYRGEATPENVSRLLPMVIPVEELVTILCGSAPLLEGRPLDTGVDGRRVLLTVARGDLGQQLALGEEATVLTSRVRRARAREEAPAYDVTFDRFAGRGGVRFPLSVKVDAPAAGADVALQWREDLEVNGAIEPRLFELPSPRGVRVVELAHGEAVPPGEGAVGE